MIKVGDVVRTNDGIEGQVTDANDDILKVTYIGGFVYAEESDLTVIEKGRPPMFP